MEEQAPSTPTISFGDIIMNVFASPSEAFEGLRTSPVRASVWVVPLILLILLSCGSLFLINSNDSLKAQSEESMRQVYQRQVETNRMTQQQADQAIEGMERMGGVMIAIRIVTITIFSTAVFFVVALVLWPLGKVGLKAIGGYGKYLELWGTSQWINIFGTVVTIGLILGLNSIYASPSAALAIYSTFDLFNTTHRILTLLNVFTIWQFVVVGIGLSKYAQKPLALGIGMGAGLWIVWTAITYFISSAAVGG